VFDDLPKRSPLKRFFGFVLFLAIIGSVGYFVYQKYTPSQKAVSPKVLPTKIVDSSNQSPILKPSPSPLASPSPLVSATPDYKVPAGETYVTSSTADTNGDNKTETLVVSAQNDGKFHIYVLDNTSSIVFENKNMPAKPIRISTQAYDPTKEGYLSWMLVMSENSGDLFFVHYNGTAYEIPQNISL